jgi:hypothetical protein
MNEFMAFRGLQMFQQTGATMLFSRYIPGMQQMSKQKQTAKLQDLITRGLAKLKAEAAGTAGSFERMKLAATDMGKEIGDAVSHALRLPEMFNRMTTVVKGLEKSIHDLAPETRKWVVGVGAALALFGPVTLILTKTLNIMVSLVAAAFKLSKVMVMNVLPAMLAVGAAFAGWEFGKTLREVKIGM